MSKRVAILTGGGEVPGLNMCIKSLVYKVIDLGFEPLGVRKGWEGLIQYNPQEPNTFSQHFVELTKNRVRSIDQTPGSFLHSSRIDPRQTPPEKVPSFLNGSGKAIQDLTGHLLRVIERLGVVALIILGDDDMLHYAAVLSQRGVPIIAIPKTIHNNINGTDYTLGFSTGLARSVDFIHELRALASSREQIIVIETFADQSGYSALLTAYLAGVDRTIIPAVAYDPQRLTYLVQQDKQMNPNNYAVVTVADGSRIARDKVDNVAKFLSPVSVDWEKQAADNVLSTPFGQHSSGRITAELLQNLTGDEVIFQQLTYLLRGGRPDGQDLLGGTNFGLMAAQLLDAGQFGRMTAFRRGETWTHVDLSLAQEGTKAIDLDAWYDPDSYQPRETLIWGYISQ